MIGISFSMSILHIVWAALTLMDKSSQPFPLVIPCKVKFPLLNAVELKIYVDKLYVKDSFKVVVYPYFYSNFVFNN